MSAATSTHGWRKAALAALAGLTLWLLPSLPARAENGISACFSAVGDLVKDQLDALNYVTNVDPTCYAKLGTATSGDPDGILLAALTGLMATLDAAGAFNDFGSADTPDRCNAAVQGAVSYAIAQLLALGLDTPPISTAFDALGLSKADRDKIKAVATDPDLEDQAYSMLQSIAGLSLVFSDLSCACSLAANGLIGDVKVTVQDASSCADFLADCIGSLGACAGDLLESAVGEVANIIGGAVSDIAGAIGDVYCAFASLWGGCDDGSPAPAPVYCSAGASDCSCGSDPNCTPSELVCGDGNSPNTCMSCDQIPGAMAQWVKQWTGGIDERGDPIYERVSVGCVCAKGLWPQRGVGSDPGALAACTCSAPLVMNGEGASATCGCPNDNPCMQTDGTCGPPPQLTCDDGQQPTGNQCYPTCPKPLNLPPSASCTGVFVVGNSGEFANMAGADTACIPCLGGTVSGDQKKCNCGAHATSTLKPDRSAYVCGCDTGYAPDPDGFCQTITVCANDWQQPADGLLGPCVDICPPGEQHVKDAQPGNPASANIGSINPNPSALRGAAGQPNPDPNNPDNICKVCDSGIVINNVCIHCHGMEALEKNVETGATVKICMDNLGSLGGSTSSKSGVTGGVKCDGYIATFSGDEAQRRDRKVGPAVSVCFPSAMVGDGRKPGPGGMLAKAESDCLGGVQLFTSARGEAVKACATTAMASTPQTAMVLGQTDACRGQFQEFRGAAGASLWICGPTLATWSPPIPQTSTVPARSNAGGQTDKVKGGAGSGETDKVKGGGTAGGQTDKVKGGGAAGGQTDKVKPGRTTFHFDKLKGGDSPKKPINDTFGQKSQPAQGSPTLRLQPAPPPPPRAAPPPPSRKP